MVLLCWEGKRFPSEVGEEECEPSCFEDKMLLHSQKLNGTLEALTGSSGLFGTEAVSGWVTE